MSRLISIPGLWVPRHGHVTRVEVPDLSPHHQHGRCELTGIGIGVPFGASGVSSFLPTRIADLSGWWSMRSALDRTVVAGRVTQANDKSELGRHFTEVGGKGPTFEIAGWNGLPCMLFNGTNMYLIANGVAADFSGDDKPLTIVATMQDVGAGAYYYIALGHSVSNLPLQYLYRSGGLWKTAKRHDAGGGVLGNIDDACGANRYCVSWVHTGQAESLYLNGAATAIAGSPSNVGVTTLDRFVAGCRILGGAYSGYSNYRLAELMIYKRALTTTERQDVEGYLIGEWGVS